MLNKLAVKNISKSFRDYGIYFLTLVLGVSIFYMFNSIYAQQSLMEISEAKAWYMESIQELLAYLSVVVAVILGFLIVYANNFFIKQRKKELGIYMTLGMTKGSVSKIILLETSLMALTALGVGLIMGVFGAQAMSVFTAKIFDVELTRYRFIFSLAATIKSIAFFGIVFLVVILFNTVAIGRFKLIDLLYAKRKNETLRIKRIITSVIIFLVSIICLGTAYFLIIDNGFLIITQQFLLSIILGTIGTILFFLSLSGFLIKVVQINKRWYYKDLNMFVLRQLNSKINTNFLSISVVCITLLLVIGILSSGFGLQEIVSRYSPGKMRYDFNVTQHIDQTDLKEEGVIYSYFSDEVRARDDIEFTESLNYILNLRYGDFDIELNDYENYREALLIFISLSDYNEELELQGLQPIELDQGKYLFTASTWGEVEIAEQFIEKNISLEGTNWSLSPSEEIDLASQGGGNFNGVIVVPDEVVETMEPIESVMKIKFKNEEAESFYMDLFQKSLEPIYFVSRSDLEANVVGVKATVLFFAIYLGLIFMISCAAILAIQQLSEAADNKERYALLRKLGVEKKMINKALFMQILCYFMFPLGLAIIHSYFGLTAVNDLTQSLMRQDIVGSSLITSTFVIVIYSLYFILTYIGSKNIINKK